MPAGHIRVTGTGKADGEPGTVVGAEVVPDGQVWYVATASGRIDDNAASGGIGSVYKLAVRVTRSFTSVPTASNSIITDDLDVTDETSQNTVTVGVYAYPGDTVELFESEDDVQANSQLSAEVNIRRVI